MKTKKYRGKIYDYYQSAGQKSSSPDTVADLKPRSAMLRNIIKMHFPLDRNISILDLGCGHGAFIYFMKEAGYKNVVGVDISPEQVQKANALNIPEVAQGDLLEYLIDLNNETQDCVISFDVIEHFNKNELFMFIEQVYRVLKPQGKWIIHAPNGEPPFGGMIFFGDYTHELAFTPRSMTQVMKSMGFSKLSFYEDRPIPHGVKSSIRWILWHVIRFFLRLYMVIETGYGGSDLVFSQNFLSVVEK